LDDRVTTTLLLQAKGDGFTPAQPFIFDALSAAADESVGITHGLAERADGAAAEFVDRFFGSTKAAGDFGG